MKIVTIGASPYGPLPRFLEDLRTGGGRLDELTLVEMNPQLLSLELTLAQRLMSDAGLSVEVTGTRSPIAALPGSTAVLLAVSQSDPARRQADREALCTVLYEEAACRVVAELLATLRAGHVVLTLCEGLRVASPSALLLLSLPWAGVLTEVGVRYGGISCLGVEAPPAVPRSGPWQQQRLAALARVSLQGLDQEGDAAWRQALSGADSPLMAAALALLGGKAVQVESLCFPFEGEIAEGPTRLDAKGIHPLPFPLAGQTPDQVQARRETAELRALAARAAALGDRGALREWIEIHPALHGTDRLLTLDLLLSLIDTQPEQLPQFV